MNENMGLGANGATVDHTPKLRALLALNDKKHTKKAAGAKPLALTLLWDEDSEGSSAGEAIKAQCIAQAYRLLVQVRPKHTLSTLSFSRFRPCEVGAVHAANMGAADRVMALIASLPRADHRASRREQRVPRGPGAAARGPAQP